MKYVCIWLIRLYRKYISPLKRSPCCRFTPTCSAYALEAFTEWGFFVGLGLTVWRILRCNPFCRAGYDPVPERKRKRRDKAANGEPCQSDTSENETGGEMNGKQHNDDELNNK